MAGTSFATKKACLNTCELRSLGITVTLFRPVGQFIPLHGILVMYRASWIGEIYAVTPCGGERAPAGQLQLQVAKTLHQLSDQFRVAAHPKLAWPQNFRFMFEWRSISDDRSWMAILVWGPKRRQHVAIQATGRSPTWPELPLLTQILLCNTFNSLL